MDQNKGNTLSDLIAELNQDQEFRKEDRKIRPYFDLVVQLIQRRNELGLTQSGLAELLGTHQSRISKIESGEHDLRLSTIIDIAEALKTEVSIQLVPYEESDPSELVNYINIFTTNVIGSKESNLIRPSVKFGEA